MRKKKKYRAVYRTGGAMRSMNKLAVGNIKAGVVLGTGAAITDKIYPAASGNFATIAGFMPAVNAMEMSKIMLKRKRRRK